MKVFALSAVALAILGLTGCQATGDQYAANVYQAGQVNQRQAAKTVEILAVLPAKVQVDNRQNKQMAQVGGALIGALGGALIGGSMGHGYRASNNQAIGLVGGGVAGAAAGSMVNDSTLVAGVSITYRDSGQVFNSAQVGRACEFHPGTAVMVATSVSETRIQPNAECPPQPQ